MTRAWIERRFSWAILPTKEDFPIEWMLTEEAEREFKNYSSIRKSNRCGPFRSVSTKLLQIFSPVTVDFSIFEEAEFKCAESDLANFSNENGFQEVWRRGGGYIGFTHPTGLRRFDFLVDDHWESMFLPKGR